MSFFVKNSDNNNISRINFYDGLPINILDVHIEYNNFIIYPINNFSILAVLCLDYCKIKFYNYDTNEFIGNIKYNRYIGIDDFMFTNDGKYLILFSANFKKNLEIYKIDVIDSNKIIIDNPISIIISEFFSNCINFYTGELILKGIKNILIFNIENYTEISYLEYDDLLPSIKYSLPNLLEISPLGNLLAYEYFSRQETQIIKIINYTDKKTILQLTMGETILRSTLKFLNNDENNFVVLTENEIKVYNINSETPLHIFDISFCLYSIDIDIFYSDFDEKNFIIFSNNYNLKIYDLEDYSEKYTIDEKYPIIRTIKSNSPLQLW